MGKRKIVEYGDLVAPSSIWENGIEYCLVERVNRKIWLYESKAGIRRCYDAWDLRKAIKEEGLYGKERASDWGFISR